MINREISENKKLLIVDDDKSVVDAFTLNLEHNGYKVYSAFNGNQALEKTDEQFFPVIILDIRLPDINGVELLERIKSKSPDTQIIMATGYPTAESLRNSFGSEDSKAFGYLTKPVSEKELTKVVDNAFDKYKYEKSNEQILYEDRDYICSLLVINEKGEIININKATEEFLGFSKGEIRGKNIIELLKGDINFEFFREASHMKKFDGLRLVFASKAGKSLGIKFSGTVIKDDEIGVISLVGVMEREKKD